MDFGSSMSFGGASFSSSPAMSLPSGMKSRCSAADRKKRLREGKADERTEEAIVKGLEYLTSQQDKETGALGTEYKVGVTGLTLLAYLGHCETPESREFGDSVIKAAVYLMDQAIKNEGYLNTEEGKGNGKAAYEHAIGTYALAELYTMTKGSGKPIPRLEAVLKKCVGIIVDSQDPKGGWSYGYGVGGTEDMSVSSWMIQALKAAHNTGRNFNDLFTNS